MQILSAPRNVFIYALVDPRTEIVRYIGKADDPQYRFRKHIGLAKRGRKTRCCSWIRCLLNLGFVPVLRIIEQCNAVEWRTRESHWIAVYGRADIGEGLLANHTDGGDGIAGASAELRDRLSRSHMGHRDSAETIAKKSAAAKANVITPEWRKRMSDGKRGHARPQHVREKISASLKGRKILPPEHYVRLGAMMRGKKRPPEVGQKISAAKKGKPYGWRMIERWLIPRANDKLDAQGTRGVGVA